jgi:hypothetical protein
MPACYEFDIPFYFWGFIYLKMIFNPEGDTKLASSVLSSHAGLVNVNVCTLYIPNESCCNNYVIIKSDF